MKGLVEIIKALYSIKDAIKGESNEGGGSDEKSLGYFELTNKPIGVIVDNLATPLFYNEEALIKIEDFVEQLGVPKREALTYYFVYDKDVSNTINFDRTYNNVAEISSVKENCIELAPNRFCFEHKQL